MNRRGFFKLTALLGLPSLARAMGTEEKKNRRFEGKVVVITGATSGIGEFTAKEFAIEGAKVFFCGRRNVLGQRVEREIRAAGGEATYFKADVRNESEVKAFCEGAAEKYGGIDIAFNNAGWAQVPMPLHETPFDVFDNMMKTHAYGVFFSMKYEIPYMLKAGKGRIVNNSSLGSMRAFPDGQAAYEASKAALFALNHSGAVEYAKKNILVNTINPFCVRTPMIENRAKFKNVPVEYLARFMPNPKLTEPKDVARLVMFLCSDENTVLSGTDLDLSLGYLVKA